MGLRCIYIFIGFAMFAQEVGLALPVKVSL